MPLSSPFALPWMPGLQALLAMLILLLPCLLVLAAGVAWRRSPQDESAWRLAHGIQLAALLLAVLCGVSVGMHGAASLSPVDIVPAVRIDVLGSVMMGLTSFIGWVIVRYSRRYLAGDPARGRYLAWLCLTLASVWLLVALNNLLLLVLAWAASSLTLHQLLMFYKERPAAVLAAHKKFLLSRAADLLSLGGTWLVFQSLHTLQLDRIAHAIAAGPADKAGLSAAALLFAMSAILKCAQLPFHGWLLQVMEAPTPVSALLHAGIVNIGGFVLLRVTALLETSPPAQLWLVVVGSVSAALAALVMMTRISVKVMLAWSTCAQMGFMLLEIGLGAYPLALLHLLAHSLYKAHAFLAAGETVARHRVLSLFPANSSAAPRTRILAYIGLLPAIALAGMAGGLNPLADPALWVLGGAMLLGLAPLADAIGSASARRQIGLLWLTAFGLTLAYCLWHRVFAGLIPASATTPAVPGIVFAAACLLGLTLVQQLVLGNPAGRLARWLHPRAFAGFHLDEIFTRLTLCIWPVRLRRPERKQAVPYRLLAASPQENP